MGSTRRAAGWLTAGAVTLAALFAPSVASAAPAPSPGPTSAPHLPVDVQLGGLHLSVDVPLGVTGLLGALGLTSPSSTPALPVTGTPSRPPTRTVADPRPATVRRPAPPHQPSVTSRTPRPATALPPARTRSGAGPTARHVRSAGSRPVAAHPRPAASALGSVLHPSLPVAVLMIVVLACGAGTVLVVRAAGHRRETPTTRTPG